MPAKKEEAISAFERRRLENIAANNAILRDISSTAAKIIPLPKSQSAKKPRRPPTVRVKREPVDGAAKSEPVRVTRQSSRLAGLDAPPETLKRKAEVEALASGETARQKRMRVAGELKLGDIKVEGRKWDGELGDIFRVGAQPGVRTFTEEDVKETTDKELKELRIRMGGLKLYEKWAVNDIKMVPERIYSMGFHPTEEKPIIFAGDKVGSMGVFDASQSPEVDEDDEEAEYPDPTISAFKMHARTISSFHFHPSDTNAVYTASYDSSIRKLDLEKGVSVDVFAPTDPSETLPISAIDMAATNPNLIFFSSLDGEFGRHDLRTEARDAEIWRLLDHKIGGFSLHPLHPHLFATASLDRTLKIWDLRKITGKGDLRHPALLGEHESRLSVSHASWSSGGQIATSSYDDTIKIYNFTDAGSWSAGQDLSAKQMEPAHRVRHNNQTGRWVTILKPQWQLRPRDGLQKFVIGNMNRFVDVFAADGEQLAQLDGEGITAVPAVAHFHPSLDWVAGGTASGKLCLWM
ncbi:DNA damage-binding protein CMR1 [Coniochaeta hoffmannii]|uniref:DNA damage-binding protein CMR1 n=1 Tax=Coniochaeta hoffmannii TaxID=91930 RepID=A0AA38RT45_9PEZI|nr:DNA damage-binding protein CMR1 [Coniochaeta hoffmannii]